MDANKKIFGLDLLRAIAIILVVVSHTTYLLFPNVEHALLTLVRAMGAVGVDLFFVLSGFLIGGILLKKMQQNKTRFSYLWLFFKRRWLRTLPNYLVILLVNIALISLYSIPQSQLSIASYFLFLQNFNTPHPDFFTEAWSLSIEEYAYLLLPIILYIICFFYPKKQKTKFFLNTTITIILALLILKMSYYLNTDVTNYKQWSASFRKVVIYRLDAIYIGFLFVYFYQKYTTFFNQYKKYFFLIGTIIFMVLHLYLYLFQATPKNQLFFYVFLYLQGVVLSLASLFPLLISINMNGLFQKIIQYISTRSYAIYLINYSIVLLNIQRVFNLQNFSMLQKTGCLILYISFTVLFSELLYRGVEKPILRFRNQKYPAR